MLIVFTRSSLPEYIEYGRAEGFQSGNDPGTLGNNLFMSDARGCRFFVHREDDQDSRLILVNDWCWELIIQNSTEVATRLLERIDRASRAMAHPPVSLPHQWSKFSHENLLAFFALPRPINQEALRWVAESLEGGHAAFWWFTDRNDPKPLQSFTIDHAPVSDATLGYHHVLEEAAEAFANLRTRPQQLQPSIDLMRVGAGSVARERSYSEWLPHLTDAQQAILENALTDPLKIRGVAGSGKTLTLELKALHELYKASEMESGGQGTAPSSAILPRILFLTHSWSMAEQVEEAFRRLDERGLSSKIDVMPLIYLKEWLQGPLSSEVEVLGEDSLDGKQQQMRLISEAIEHIKASTWASYKANVSEWVRQGVDSDRDDTDRLRLCWALLREFAEIFDSREIKTLPNALQKYIDLPREGWMVPLETKADRELSFRVYKYYVRQLVEEGLVTTDQVVDDLRRDLEKYEWNAIRAGRGYDIIFVDEFHLFSDPERYLLHLLTREAEKPPRLVMAMDPSQSVFLLLTGLAETEISRTTSGMIQRGQTKSIDLKTTHRFTEPVFNFLRYLHTQMPNVVELGHDWVYDSIPDSGKAGRDVPRARFVDRPQLAETGVAEAFALQSAGTQEQRVALIGVGNSELEAIRKVLKEKGHASSSYVLIDGRDEIEQLRYSRRALIVTAAEYAAGLQFSHVVVVGGTSGNQEYGHGTSALRALYSQFYLAASRAEEHLTVVAPQEQGGFGEVLGKAVEANVAIT
ncbi:UvrD-helicase domain-containing protein [Streptomyces sp. PsTaAH-124]|uniref:UvrD-helicase domain-containing protein n=1 Tax=Streptomyces sp. PsTaAH-124 TaxID=1157638 RepID=UPI00035F4776|nr:UvrD-helicase domain-containing protein [Streptomyces sp. PsTaAH-124]